MKKTLLLVDGSSYLYRAYHAMPNLRNARGEPTSALYGVIAMLKRLQHDYQADYAACVFDAPGKTFRDDVYPEYKANRPSMPADLASQIEPIHRAVKALGWPVISQPGVEADDVIGTLARQATEKGLHTIVSTGDKDLAQLVNEHVELVNTMNNERQDVDGVIERFGVRPDQIIDFLILTGDASDNIPGVPKVGPKTAARWLTAHDTLEQLLENAESIKGVAGQNLRDTAAQFPMTRQLVTIRTDCDIDDVPNSWDSLVPGKVDTDTLVDLYNEFGFRTWLRELTDNPDAIPEQDARLQAPAEAAPEKVDYVTVIDWDTFNQWLRRIRAASLVALDTETTGLDPMQARLVGVSLSIEPGQACYIPVAHRGPDNPQQLP
ncbi:MAG TPA: 5'-3' exonuclease H3TH domain-containing protein, partial [Burkholderiaceae bacterium]|nr:5'-3' exonuclease H3TH domain-containing protein [Burkholderiaceae bacterium]